MTNPSKVLFSVILAGAFSASAFAYDTDAKLDKCKRDVRLDKQATILKTVDGDTVHIKNKNGSYSVRMLGIDTPETHFLGHSQGEWGNRASDFLKDMLPPGTEVTLEFGETPCDGHGRVLAHLFKGRTHVNGEIVRQGLAVNYCVAPSFRYCEELGRYVQDALDSKRGMFSDPNFELPYDFRRRIENAPQRSYVGSIRTKIVLKRGRQNDTPIADRVFFYTKEDIKEPYHLEEDFQ